MYTYMRGNVHAKCVPEEAMQAMQAAQELHEREEEGPENREGLKGYTRERSKDLKTERGYAG